MLVGAFAINGDLTIRFSSGILRIMRKKDILTGLIVVLVIAGVIFAVRRAKTPKLLVTPTPSTEESIENSFNLTIPEDVDKVDLKAVSDVEGMGIATKKFKDGKFSHTVLADLPDPSDNMFYEGWLSNTSGDSVSTGKMRLAKGGYILEFESAKDYSQYNKVTVTLEKTFDKVPEKRILEGSF